MLPEDWIPIVVSLIALLGTGYNLYLYRKQAELEKVREKRDQERFKIELESYKRALEESTKQLRLFVDFPGGIPAYEEYAHLVIINVGQRPVTVADALADVYRNNNPSNVFGRTAMILTKNVRDENFPHKLDAGESMEIQLGVSRAYLERQKIGLKVEVFDVEGDVYTDFTFREHDTLHGFYRATELNYE